MIVRLKIFLGYSPVHIIPGPQISRQESVRSDFGMFGALRASGRKNLACQEACTGAQVAAMFESVPLCANQGASRGQ